ncbi:Transferase family [Musa troglodytarum]|uniref:Transferase family n=1 Tax=Musa troglodytarum TaxID=320322 RepID=A0A9E7JQ96_9LILI|nr:Transferase family [Musa troglodytarum]
MAVRVLSSCLVAPEGETPRRPIWLSTLDLFQIRSHVPTVYFYRPPIQGDGSGFFSPEVLKAGLRKALVPFHLFAGRIGTDDSGRTEIECNGKGVLFVEAKAEELTIDKFGDFAPSPEYRRLLIPTVDPDEGDDAIPVLLLQCGGVCLGVGVHHLVSDGVASLLFINAWSDITRGIEPAVPPFLDRSLLLPRSPPSVHFPHDEFKRYAAGIHTSADKPAVSTAILELTADQIAALKRSCAATMPSPRRVTTYEAVASRVWRQACMARRLDAHSETRVYITTDARRRLRPPLPEGYIGNVIFPTVAIAAVGDVVSEPPGDVASRIHRATAIVDDEYLRSALDFMEMEEDVRSLGRWAGNFTSADLSITCWTSLPIYEADFGWGRPEFMGPASMFYGGLCYIMPKPPGKEWGVLVAVSMEAEYMDYFKELLYDFSSDQCNV